MSLAALARAFVRRVTGRKVRPLPIWERFFTQVFAFADWTDVTLAGRKVAVCVVHDSLALEAGRRLHERTGCGLIVDAVEYPDFSGRASNLARSLRNHPPSLALVAAHEMAIVKAADLVITGTPDVAAWFTQQGHARKVGVVRNCLDYVSIQKDDAIRRDCKLSEGDRLLLFPNNMYAGGGFELCLRAMAKLGSDIHLATMAPMAEMPESLSGEIRNLGLSGRVHFLSRKPPRELIRYRSGADIALVMLDPATPGFHSSLPNRLFETVMSRTPLVVSDLPNHRWLVEVYGIGEVAKSYDAQALADAISTVLASPSRYSEKAEQAAKELSWEREKGVFLDLIQPVLDAHMDGDVVFLARKDMSTNQRTFRHMRTIAELGRRTALFAQVEPMEELRVAGAQYFAMSSQGRPSDGPE
ncbi:MAG TPA: glycosyltransferase [Rhizobiaceae bacterium]|nr:glycosyltransferase [Rhizobiaceae bacterium]